VSECTCDSTDLTKRLRFLVSLNDPAHGGPYGGTAATQCMEAMTAAANEIDRLRAWRAEACEEFSDIRSQWGSDPLWEKHNERTVSDLLERARCVL
jgi:hypothetical protein